MPIMDKMGLLLSNHIRSKEGQISEIFQLQGSSSVAKLKCKDIKVASKQQLVMS